MPEIDYDFEADNKIPFDPSYNPNDSYSDHEEFVIDIYKNILQDKVDRNSSGVKQWVKNLNNGVSPQEVVNHFKNIAQQQLNKNNTLDLGELLGEEDKGSRIAVVIPESGVDVLMINALLSNLKKQYKKYNIYIFTKPEFFQFIDDNPNVYKLMHYNPAIENSLFMEGIGEHEGLFNMVFYPHVTTQKNTSYIHNGSDKLQFSL